MEDAEVDAGETLFAAGAREVLEASWGCVSEVSCLGRSEVCCVAFEGGLPLGATE